MKQKKHKITIIEKDIGKSILVRKYRVNGSFRTRKIDVSDVLGAVYSFDVGKTIIVEK